MASLQVPLLVNDLRNLSHELNHHIPAADAVTDQSANHLAALIDALLKTAHLIHIPTSHKSAACNPLCSILERCKAHEDIRIRALANVTVLSKLFDIYLETYDNAKPKSMRQVLLTLCSLLPKTPDPEEKQVIIGMTNTLFGILFHEADNSKAKQSLQALSYLVQKDVYFVDELIMLADLGRPPTGRAFLSGLMEWVAHQDTAQTAGSTICVTLDYAKRQNSDLLKPSADGCPVWVQPIREFLSKRPGALLNFKSHVFPDLFKPSLSDYLRFLKEMRLETHLRLRSMITKEGDMEISILFTSLQVGKDMGIVQEVDYRFNKRIEIRDGLVLVPDKLLGRLLAHERPQTRLLALALLVSSSAITRPLTFGTFEALKRNLHHFHADTDANFRGETISLILALLDRLRAAAYNLNRTLLKESGISAQDLMGNPSIRGSETVDTLRAHIDFVRWHLKFLSSELIPTAAYQRHISALKSLTLIMKSGLDPLIPVNVLSRSAQGQAKWPFTINVLNRKLVRQLFDLIMDPFDDVRHASASILKLGSPAQAQADQACAQFLLNGEHMMLKSGRADHADGVARVYDLLFERRKEAIVSGCEASKSLPEWMYSKHGIIKHLIFRLDQTISAAKQNMSTAVNAYPMHGTLSALRYIVEQPSFYPSIAAMGSEDLQIWKALHDHILSDLREIWDCVKSVLCVDAPEGYVPEDMEEEPDLTTKDILSYSWRALKEASNLLRVIVSKAPFELAQLVILSRSEFEDLGKLCFTQLAELRHRGAFSTVAQTFAAFCLRCSRSQDQEIKALLDKWYAETLRCIRDKGSMITRRSAGLPSLVTGILSAAPEGPLFDKVVGDLKSEASNEPTENANIDGSHLPQVHALNCLKDVFTNTKLSRVSEPHMGEGLSLAASKLESNIWAIRNCGLMLFRALIDRLLGSGTTQNWKETDHLRISRLSYRKYPNLLEIITSLLNPRSRTGSRNELTSKALEGVFPALQILQRAKPPPEKKEEIQALVFKLTASSHWHVRDMAARTIASLLDPEERVEWYLWLLELPTHGKNALHGRLLTALYLAKEHIKYMSTSFNKQDFKDEMGLLCFALRENFNHLHGNSDPIREANTPMIKCPFTRAAYMEIVVTLEMAWRAASIDSPWTTGGVMGSDFHRRIAAYRTKWTTPRPRQREPRDALLRRAVIQNLSLTTPWDGEVERLLGPLGDCFNVLARQDPDTYRSCIEIMLPLWSDHTRHRSKQPHDANVGRGIGLILSKPTLVTEDVEIHSTIRQVVAELVDNGLPLVSTMQGDVMVELYEWTNRGFGSPSLQEATLRLRGEILDLRLKEEEHWRTLSREYVLFNNTVACNLDETMPFSTRFAAVSALSSLRGVWHDPVHLPRDQASLRLLTLLSLIQTTYTALNDDDDEIRDKAATIVKRIIGASDPETESTPSIVPLAAASKLLGHTAQLVASFSSTSPGDSPIRHPTLLSIVNTFAVSRLLAAASPAAPSSTPSSSPLSSTPHLKPAAAASLPQQLFDEPPVPDMLDTPFSTLLALAAKEDTALFAAERQNLFIDPLREITQWSAFMLALPLPPPPPSPNHVEHPAATTTTTVSPALARAFSTWTRAGLDALTSLARGRPDSVLGWGSQAKMTTLAWAVVRAAGVALVWRVRGVRRVSGRGSEWMRALWELRGALEEAGAPAWLSEGVDEALAAGVRERLKVVAARVRGLVDGRTENE
ncbi:putative death-receptor fusion protein-domain-containing protein [Phyllosticta citriasiana]|uniref:Death-receptor fusion protein-domain-containing protein n=1 Tax=Phyllosticta citriasiana TaxID=595635 RepID=A0ABR1K9T9_9PEZI